MAYVIKNKKRINYTIYPDRVVFDDQEKTVAYPSVKTMNISQAYDEAGYVEEETPPVVIPPVVVEPPVTEPKPGIPPYIPNSGTVRNVTWKELDQLKDVDTARFKIKGFHKGQIWAKNWRNVEIDLLEAGIELEPYSVGMELNDLMENIKIYGASFTSRENRGANACIQHRPQIFYDGTDSSVQSKGLELYGIKSDNAGAIFRNDGFLDVYKGFRGISEGFKMFYCTLINSASATNALYLTGAENFEVAYNYFEAINLGRTEHNNLYSLQGNGRLHHNKAVNYQGNFSRTQPMQITGKNKTLSFDNNIAYKSQKYGMFELQIFEDKNNPTSNHFDSKFFKPLDLISIKNNTGGLFNTSRDWQGQLLDNYLGVNDRNIFGIPKFKAIEILNNLGFEMNSAPKNEASVYDKITNMLAGIPIEGLVNNNKHFMKWQDAVTDLTTFKSKHAGIGAEVI